MMELLKLLDIKSSDKLGAIQEVGQYFTKLGFKVIDINTQRPWGFFFYFDPEQTDKFIKEFFAGVELEAIDTSQPLQPKTLVFEPNKVLSWQYHNRRSEIWRVITNNIQVRTSPDDNQGPAQILKFGEVINLTKGLRHRGGATQDGWGAVAEIWQHTDPNNFSDEDDIVRLQDDYGRAP